MKYLVSLLVNILSFFGNKSARHEILLKKMMKCEIDRDFRHKLDRSGFWGKYHYGYVNELRGEVLGIICDELRKDIAEKQKILDEANN